VDPKSEIPYCLFLLSEYWSYNFFYGLGILTTALLTLLTPLIADFGLVPLVAMSKLVTITNSGSYFSTVVSKGVFRLLAEHLGWASIFYI
jgi:hypothetical protein